MFSFLVGAGGYGDTVSRPERADCFTLLIILSKFYIILANVHKVQAIDIVHTKTRVTFGHRSLLWRSKGKFPLRSRTNRRFHNVFESMMERINARSSVIILAVFRDEVEVIEGVTDSHINIENKGLNSYQGEILLHKCR